MSHSLYQLLNRLERVRIHFTLGRSRWWVSAWKSMCLRTGIWMYLASEDQRILWVIGSWFNRSLRHIPIEGYSELGKIAV